MKPVYLTLSQPTEGLPSCSSRFWGNPDLPKGFDYPMYIDEEGDPYPYFFICQIRLADLDIPDCPLPATGLLQFYAKIDSYLGYEAAADRISGHISSPEDIKVLYFPDCTDMEEAVLLDEDGEETSPAEMQITYTTAPEKYQDEHILFAAPTHREWETWDPPFENWEILLQIDSFSGSDFSLNFMDCGVLCFLIDPEDLRAGKFDNVRGIVLST